VGAIASSKIDVSRFFFALWFPYHFSAHSAKARITSHLPPANYSFKVVFRVFRDFHSVPVKRLYVPVGT
jgi:hypothetical protein